MLISELEKIPASSAAIHMVGQAYHSYGVTPRLCYRDSQLSLKIENIDIIFREERGCWCFFSKISRLGPVSSTKKILHYALSRLMQTDAALYVDIDELANKSLYLWQAFGKISQSSGVGGKFSGYFDWIDWLEKSTVFYSEVLLSQVNLFSAPESRG